MRWPGGHLVPCANAARADLPGTRGGFPEGLLPRALLRRPKTLGALTCQRMPGARENPESRKAAVPIPGRKVEREAGRDRPFGNTRIKLKISHKFTAPISDPARTPRPGVPLGVVSCTPRGLLTGHTPSLRRPSFASSVTVGQRPLPVAAQLVVAIPNSSPLLFSLPSWESQRLSPPLLIAQGRKLSTPGIDVEK